jgi:Xaa-Pro aminopeptidase
MDKQLVAEKLDQAVALLAEHGLDVWLTFVRETAVTPDPVLPFVSGVDVVWHSAFLVSRGGRRVAIVGRHDADTIRNLGAYTDVIGYDESIRPALRSVLTDLDPQQIAINTSESDPSADGLSHGLWRTLVETLAATPYVDRLVPAERLLNSLRGCKSALELKRVRAAVRVTERLFARLSNRLKRGLSERQIAGILTAERHRLGLGAAWDEPYCPAVNAGPDSPAGHTPPGAHKWRRGHLLHIDFGVQAAGYCSDLQRMWYALDKGERRAPDDVRRAWEACWSALDAGADRLRVGAVGWEVDAAARETLAAAGYPEYRHALGHQLGRAAHDGGTLLGPRWDRYGNAPLGAVEVGNVFTLELGVEVPDRGTIGLEEDVLVTETGLEWLSKPQRKLWLLD